MVLVRDVEVQLQQLVRRPKRAKRTLGGRIRIREVTA